MTNSLSVWLLQTGEMLPLAENVKKMRTAILADKLVERGHNVLWWVSAFDHFKKDWVFKEDTEVTVREGLKIKALKGIGYRKNVSLSRFVDHRIIAWKFRRQASAMPKPDVIVTSMPPHDLAYQTIMFAKKHDIPVLVDIRDPWPDIFFKSIPKAFQSFVRKLLFFDFQMIKKTMQMADGLIAVTNTFLEWGLKYAGRMKLPADKLLPLGYKRHKTIDNSKSVKFSHLIEEIKDKFIIFFVGTMSRKYHNPSILLEVAGRVKDENIHFIIAGTGELFEELKSTSKNLNNVTLTGWLDQDGIELWLKHAKVGVCPVARNVSLPTNKIYAYLSAGLPVISAFQGDLKEIIEKYQIGYYYPLNDVDALVDCIKRLYEDKELYAKMSANAKKVFDEMFDADKIYKEYAEHIERVAKQYNYAEALI